MLFNTRVVDTPTYPMAALAAKKNKLLAAGKRVFDFGTGDPIEPTPEFIRTALAQGIPTVSQYPSVRGTKELRVAIQGYLKRRFGVDTNPETEILPCTGSKESMYNIPFLVIGPNNPKRIIVAPQPGYPVMERGAVISGAEYHPVGLSPENNFMLELNSLPASVLERTALAWINYPHNPSGRECDREYLKRQVEVAHKYDILLCSDECYVDVYFSNTPPPSVLEITKKGVLAFHSCSKRSGMTAYRAGFVAGDPTIVEAYAMFRNSVGTAMPIFTQHAATAAWNDDTHSDDRRAIFREKMNLFKGFFKQAGFTFLDTNATFYLWVEAPRGMDGKQYADRLLEHGIIVSPGAFFGENCAQFFRLALVPSLADCTAAISTWKQV